MAEQELSIVTSQEVSLAISPEDALAGATRAAKALKGVLDGKSKKVIMNGEQYLEFEDWLTVANFYGVGVRTHSAVPVTINGVEGAKAEADVVSLKTGIVIGGAESYCLRDEKNWRDKPWFQLASMAQTRAGAKALRNRLAWVVVLAGLKPTPAEELQGEIINPDNTGVPAEHYCLEHKTTFFMRGKMKAFAHPIGDTKEWCHEHTEQPIQEATEAKSKPVEAVAPVTTPTPPKTDPKTITTLAKMYAAAFKDFGYQPQAVNEHLNVKTQGDIGMTPVECYAQLSRLFDMEQAAK